MMRSCLVFATVFRAFFPRCAACIFAAAWFSSAVAGAGSASATAGAGAGAGAAAGGFANIDAMPPAFEASPSFVRLLSLPPACHLAFR